MFWLDMEHIYHNSHQSCLKFELKLIKTVIPVEQCLYLFELPLVMRFKDF